jgi:hypothetical protein
MGKYTLISNIINFFGAGRISKVLLILAARSLKIKGVPMAIVIFLAHLYC